MAIEEDVVAQEEEEVHILMTVTTTDMVDIIMDGTPMAGEVGVLSDPPGGEQPWRDASWRGVNRWHSSN